MPRKKQIKLDDLKNLPNVFSEINDETEDKIAAQFGNQNPIVVEVGCGHGNYTLNLAEKYPDKNFIGIDVKGARIWTGANEALSSELGNIAFFVCGAHKLSHIFRKTQIDEIWITFPEPHLQRRKENRRLTSSNFLEVYRRILKSDGRVHLKTDNEFLFEYTLDILSSNGHRIIDSSGDLHNSEITGPPKEIITTFEDHYIKDGRPIKYICFTIK